MKTFPGFPTTRTLYTPLPNLFFTELLPLIDDLGELRLTLHFFAMLHRKRGFPRFVTLGELLGNRALVQGLARAGETAEEEVRRAVERAEARGTLLRLVVERGGKAADLLFLNTERERETMEKIRRGEISWPDVEVKPASPPVEKPTIYTLYEENIGLLTPLLAEELREAERTYPPLWIEEAFREAVSLNRRSWRYIARILERWAMEGRQHGEHRRDPGADGPPDKYIRGKYGHVVRH